MTERTHIARAMAASAAEYDARMREVARARNRETTTTPRARNGIFKESTISAHEREDENASESERTPKKGDLYLALEANKGKRSRQAKELASLAPWAWDPLVGKHAPGPSALRDFEDVVTDKALMASARGAVNAVVVKTYVRPFADSVGTTAKKVKKAAEREATPEVVEPRTKSATHETKKRVRTTMGTVTPLRLALTLDKVSQSEKSAPTRASARAVSRADKENEAPKAVKAEKPLPAPVDVAVAVHARASRRAPKEEQSIPRAEMVKPPAEKRKAAPEDAIEPVEGAKRVVVDKIVEAAKDAALSVLVPPIAKTGRAQDLSVADVRRRSLALECLLARTYVKAIKKPIMPLVKPSRQLLDAFRDFTQSRMPSVEREELSEIKLGAALSRGLDALVAKDARDAEIAVARTSSSA